MLQRGVLVSHETVRRWCATFGRAYADRLRRRRPRPGDTWRLDEVFVKINGVRQYLWRPSTRTATSSRNLAPSHPNAPSGTHALTNVATPTSNQRARCNL